MRSDSDSTDSRSERFEEVQDLLSPADHIAVRIEDLWIRYRTVIELPVVGSRRSLSLRGVRKEVRHVNAVRGISFDVPIGSVYGVIGHNGAGKSTLFRAIAGILSPSNGRIVVNGRVTPLLSLGVGFNRALTGRENVLLGGLSIGLSPTEVVRHYQEVLDFADLGTAIDSPIRTYSSGMFARLAFAVASHLDPEILLIDEALSAGDARFRNRCMNKLQELCGRDCTVIIISHGLFLITALAERCVWLEEGKVRMEGPAQQVVNAYLNSDDLIDEMGMAPEEAMQEM